MPNATARYYSAVEPFDDFTRIGKRVPVLADMRPAGQYAMSELIEIAGGDDDRAVAFDRVGDRPAVEGVGVARDDEERALFWKARKGAFGAMGRLAPDLYVCDAGGLPNRLYVQCPDGTAVDVAASISAAGRRRQDDNMAAPPTAAK